VSYINTLLTAEVCNGDVIFGRFLPVPGASGRTDFADGGVHQNAVLRGALLDLGQVRGFDALVVTGS